MLSKGFAAALALLPLISWAGEYSLTVDRVTIDTGDFSKQGIGYNGASPGPILRFREGEDVTIHVTKESLINSDLRITGVDQLNF
ncbi:multicopper oxidase domain-containing protein [Halopseudomonas sp.]|uniref:multicopper oxidase domain-containing protein n=1 Tax=Halopseudomonas sp. TaxID=2901191 RepID=UPI003003770D